jgi:hypothetical protein
MAAGAYPCPMSERSSYRVVAEFDGDWWVVSFPGFDGVSLAVFEDEILHIARDRIHAITGEPPGSIDLEVAVKGEGPTRVPAAEGVEDEPKATSTER